MTYPEALAEKLTSTKILKKNSFTIKKGETLSIDDFVNFLYEAQYRQDDFVFEPGQFAWRGAIFDVFSFSEESNMSINDKLKARYFISGQTLYIKYADSKVSEDFKGLYDEITEALYG